MSDIALVIDSLKAGGTERVAATLANTWAERGRSICVITFSDTDSDFFELDPRVRRIAIGMPLRSSGGLISFYKRIRLLRRTLKQTGAAVVVSFLPFINIQSILAGFGCRWRTIISERNDPARQLLGWPWEHLRRLLYRYAALVTANSRGALETLKEYVPASKLLFVPNPVPMPRSPGPIAHTTPSILNVGSLTFQKAQDVLLSAFAVVSSRFPEWRLTIIGKGPKKVELRSRAERLAVADRIDWVESAADPFIYYNAADIFVLPSRFEGTPNALLEAMSCSLPVVVSDASPGPLEYVEHEKNGLVVPVDNSRALAEALERFMRDEALRERLGSAARKRLAEEDTAQVMQQWDHAVGLPA